MLKIFSPKIADNLRYMLIVYLGCGFLILLFKNFNIEKVIIFYLALTISFIISYFFCMKKIVLDNSKYLVLQRFGFQKIEFNQNDIKFLNELKMPFHQRLENLEIHLKDQRVVRIFRHYISDFDQLKEALGGKTNNE